jgi:hypothetical protein
MNQDMFDFLRGIEIVKGQAKFLEHIKQYPDLEAVKGQVVIKLKNYMTPAISEFISQNAKAADQYKFLVSRLGEHAFLVTQGGSQREIDDLKKESEQKRRELFATIKELFDKQIQIHPDVVKFKEQMNSMTINYSFIDEMREYKDPARIQGIVLIELLKIMPPLIKEYIRAKPEVSKKWGETVMSITSMIYIKSRPPDETTEQRLDNSRRKYFDRSEDLLKLINEGISGVQKLAGGRRSRKSRRKTRKHRR